MGHITIYVSMIAKHGYYAREIHMNWQGGPIPHSGEDV
jgi:hypothetical protein